MPYFLKSINLTGGMFSSKCSAMEWANCPQSLREAMFQLCFTEELPVEWEKNLSVLEANGEMQGGRGFFRQRLGYEKAEN